MTAAFNRRMRKTARTVVWEGRRAQSRRLDPIKGKAEFMPPLPPKPEPCSRLGSVVRIFLPKPFVARSLQTTGGYAPRSLLGLSKNLTARHLPLNYMDPAKFHCSSKNPPFTTLSVPSSMTA
jgi:hypothetical protein